MNQGEPINKEVESKKPDNMDERSEYRRWDELIPDALGLIFRNLSLEEKLMVIPRVCKSWNRAVSGPYCWQVIDIEEWSNWCRPDCLDRMILMLVTRSGGSFREFSVTGLSNTAMFSYLVENSGPLKTLRLPRSEITDTIVEQISSRLSTVTFLDVSYCSKISARALEVIGRNCKHLVTLCRNMHPLDAQDKISRLEEAVAISTTMPRLKRLEMAYHHVDTENVLKIFSNCKELEFVDVRGCWDVKLEDKFLKENYPNLKVLGPFVLDYYETNDWEEDGCSEYSDVSEFLAWEFLAGNVGDYDDDDDSYNEEMWDDEQRLEQLELRFYERADANFAAGVYGWPASP